MKGFVREKDGQVRRGTARDMAQGSGYRRSGTASGSHWAFHCDGRIGGVS